MGRRAAQINVETKCLSKPNTISNCQLTIFASTERNAISSPLLRLPPELRNHIFSLALNHGYIPITYPERSRWKIKRAAPQCSQYRYHYERIYDLFYKRITFSSRSCCFKLKKRPSRRSKPRDHLRRPINLLFVCRQIYAETALLPYKVNTWVIELDRPWENQRLGLDHHYLYDPALFLDTLTAAQREVMQNVWSLHSFGGRGEVTMGSGEDWMWYMWPQDRSKAFRTEDIDDTSMFLLP